MKRLHVCLMLTLALLLVTVSVAGAGEKGNPGVLPPNSRVQGLTYGEWSARWWQYVFSLPKSQSPYVETGAICRRVGNVALVAVNSTLDVPKKCEVPAETTLYLELLAAECSTIEQPPFYGGNEQELRACAQSFVPTNLEASIDGVEIENPSQYISTSPLYEFVVPDDSIFDVPGGTTAQSVSYGAFLMLAPLNLGKHTIHTHGTYGDDFTADRNFELTVTTNGFSNLKDGATLSGAVEVKGNASDPKFAKWQLDVLPGGDANKAIFLALGQTPGEFSQKVDTTAFPNGEHALRLRVVRGDGNYNEYITKFVIANGAAKPAAVVTVAKAAEKAETPAAAAAPVVVKAAAVQNGFSNLKDGAKVSGEVEVKGNASDPNFAKWQLDVLPGGDANKAIFLALGQTPGEFRQKVDTTAFPNGEHALRLRVVRSDGNYDEYITKFVIAN
jgi:hypothetical protein